MWPAEPPGRLLERHGNVPPRGMTAPLAKAGATEPGLSANFPFFRCQPEAFSLLLCECIRRDVIRVGVLRCAFACRDLVQKSFFFHGFLAGRDASVSGCAHAPVHPSSVLDHHFFSN